jgi:hypothetical protein
MPSLPKPPVSVCASIARCIAVCLTVTLVNVSLANAETLSVSSYAGWQSSGFSRTALPTNPSASPISLLASVLLPSWSPENIVSESAVESSSADSATNGASLSGAVFFDANFDGVRDAGDWGIRDAIVALTSTDSDKVVIAVTDSQGNYSFKNLAADDYSITLMTSSTAPGQTNVGYLTDANGATVLTGSGVVASSDSIANIQVQSGYTGLAYDFAELVYPSSLISKRMLINQDPGVQHSLPAPPVPEVPEPCTLVLLAVAGLCGTGFARRHRN